MDRRVLRAAMAGLLLIGGGCDEVVDRVRGREVAVDTSAAQASAGALTLRLQAPGVVSVDREGTIGVILTNRGDTAVHRIRLDLLVPGWLEPAAPRPGDPEVAMAAAEEGLRLSYRMDDRPLEPGQAQVVEQRVRIPHNSPVTQGAVPGSRVVRARLVAPDGQPLAEVASEVLFDTTTRAPSGQPGDGAGAVTRDRLGPVRLGMPASALRQASAGARDTSWTQEGMPEHGVVVPLEGGGRAVAVLARDTVARIVVRDPAPRTREGLGVGSRLGELRDRYGEPCLAAGEGEVVAWFPSAPGISFALDAAVPASATPENLRQIPASARVTRWWLRRGPSRCP